MKKLLLFVLFISSLAGQNAYWTSPQTLSSLTVRSFSHSAIKDSSSDPTTPPVSVTASSPKIAIDQNGNVAAAWLENGIVTSCSQPLNGTWSDPTVLSADIASSLQLVIDPNGNATALWLEDETVMTASAPLNGQWSDEAALSEEGASSPQLAIDAAGNLIAIWARGGNIESIINPVGGNWSSPIDTIAGEQAHNPYAAIGNHGTVVAIWSDLADTVNIVCSATTTLAGTWGAPTLLSISGQNSGYARVAVNARGEALAGWFRWDVNNSDYSNVVCQTALMAQNGVWSSPTDISNPGLRIPADVRVILDDCGNAFALWATSFDGSTFALQSSVCLVNGEWSNPFYILSNNLAPCNLDCVHSPDREVRMVFLAYSEDTPDLRIFTLGMRVNTYALSISSFQMISTGQYNAHPKIASASNGSTVYNGAAWVNSDGSNTTIQVALGTETVLSPPSNPSVTQNLVDFGVLQEYQNILTWGGSPGATSYIIFRNGKLVAELYAPASQYIDHNQVQGQSVVYGVAALSGMFAQSLTSSVILPGNL